MLIKAITIENFKGISEPVRVEFKPLTLLFGANSGGKSTIIQALHYLREVLENRKLDVDKTTSGGDFIDLGGFDNFVNNHDKTKEISFKIELHQISDDYFNSSLEAATTDGAELIEDLQKEGTKYLSFSIAKRNGEIFIDHMEFYINDTMYVSLKCLRRDGGSVSENILVGSNIYELANINALTSLKGRYVAQPEKVKTWIGPEYELFDVEAEDVKIYSPLSKWRTFQPKIPLLNLADYNSDAPLLNLDYNQCVHAASDYVRYGMVGTIVDELKSMLYVGPLRLIPPRNYTPRKSPSLSRWADGLAAWDKASDPDNQMLENINLWMGKERLDTGYAFHVRVSVNFDHPVMEKLVTAPKLSLAERKKMIEELSTDSKDSKVILTQAKDNLEVSLCDIGVGISQVLPVVVAALDLESNLTIIEQPELHIHPRLQVNLGDLFIHAINKSEGKCMIIETHSEHLLLRLLRRIRETTRNTMMQDNALTPEQLSIVFLERLSGVVCARKLGVSMDGDSFGPWPEGFFEERAEEL